MISTIGATFPEWQNWYLVTRVDRLTYISMWYSSTYVWASTWPYRYEILERWKRHVPDDGSYSIYRPKTRSTPSPDLQERGLVRARLLSGSQVAQMRFAR
jgi:hypothetical protein